MFLGVLGDLKGGQFSILGPVVVAITLNAELAKTLGIGARVSMMAEANTHFRVELG